MFHLCSMQTLFFHSGQKFLYIQFLSDSFTGSTISSGTLTDIQADAASIVAASSVHYATLHNVTRIIIKLDET